MCVCVCFKAVRVGQAELNTQVLQRCISPPWRRQEGVVFDVRFHFLKCFLFLHHCINALVTLPPQQHHSQCDGRLKKSVSSDLRLLKKALSCWTPLWGQSSCRCRVEPQVSAAVHSQTEAGRTLKSDLHGLCFHVRCKISTLFLNPRCFSNYFTDGTSQTLN